MFKNISFTGTYRYDLNKNTGEKQKAVFDPEEKLMFEKGFESCQNFPDTPGAQYSLTHVVPDKPDFEVESFLASKGVEFKKFKPEELFSEESIKKRLIVQEDLQRLSACKMYEIKTKEFNDLYKSEHGFAYIGDGEPLEMPERNDSFREY